MLLLKFNIVGNLIIFYLFSMRPDQLLVDYKYSSATHFLFLCLMICLNLLHAFLFEKYNLLKVQIILKNWIIAWSLPFLIILIGLLNSYLNENYEAIYLFLKFLFIYLYSLSFCLAFNNFYKKPIESFVGYFTLIAVSITLINFILYICSIFLNINIFSGVSAFHLNNILSLPPIEGIFGPISTVFLAIYTLLYFNLNNPNKITVVKLIFSFICIFIIISSVKRSILLWFIFLIPLYLNRKNIDRNIFLGGILIYIIYNYDSIDQLNNLMTGGDASKHIMDSRLHSLLAIKDGFLNSPFFGSGLNFSNKNYNFLYSENSNADNTYVAYFLDFGFIGLGLFAIYYLSILNISKNISNLTLNNGVYLYAVMMLCSSLTEDIFNYPSGNFIIFSIFISCIIVFKSNLGTLWKKF